MRIPPMSPPYVYVFLFIPLNIPLNGLLLLRRLVERLLDDLLEDVFLVDFDGVLLVLFEVDVFFLLLFNEPKSKLMIVIGVKLRVASYELRENYVKSLRFSLLTICCSQLIFF